MYWSLENVPWTNMHDLNLDWIVNTMKQTVEQWIAYRLEMNQNYANFTAQINEWKNDVDSDFAELQQYVQDYFDNLDLNESTRYVINQMIASGEFIEVLNPSIVSTVNAWLAEHITPTTPPVDNSLSISGAAADAEITGLRINELYNSINEPLIQTSLIMEYGSFAGSNLPVNTQNTSRVYARSAIIENVGPCFFRSKIKGQNIAIYATNTLPAYEWTIRNEDIVFLPKHYNYIRIRMYNETGDLTNYEKTDMSKLLVQENINGYYEQQKVSEILNQQINGKNAVITWNTDMRVTTNGVVEAYPGVCCSELINYNENYVLSSYVENTSIPEKRGYCVFYDSDNAVLPTSPTWNDLNNSIIYLSDYKKYNPAYFRICKRINVNTGSSDDVISGQQLVDLFNCVKLYNISATYPTLAKQKDNVNVSLFNIEERTITNNTSFNIAINNLLYDVPIIINISSSYTGTPQNDYTLPSIAASKDGGALNAKILIGDKGNLKTQQIRLYPFVMSETGVLTLNIYVPSGLSLYIKNLRLSYDTNTALFTDGIEIAMHSRQGGIPRFSKYAVELIKNTGGTYCIELPKRTSDGVWLCYHDDTFDISDTFLRNSDGSHITESPYNNLPFSEIPYSYLYSLDWGIYADNVYAGTKPLLIEDFFKMCAVTGMHPCLSFHPVAQSTEANFTEIKNLAKKYNVLHHLNVKIPAVIDPTLYPLRRALTVFGYDIESYTINASLNQNIQTVINAADTVFTATGIDKEKTKAIIERFAYNIQNEDNATQTILNSGYRAGIAQNSHVDPLGDTVGLSGADIKYHIEKGVTYFTTITFSTIGTNWL